VYPFIATNNHKIIFNSIEYELYKSRAAQKAASGPDVAPSLHLCDPQRHKIIFYIIIYELKWKTTF